MNDEEFSDWVDTFIRHCHCGDGSQEFNDTFWVYDWILDAVDGVPDNPAFTPELLWKFILAVIERDSSPPVAEMLSAGALEDLLARHGKDFIARVELQARQNPVFRHVLGGVWKNTMTNDIWARVEVARLGKTW